MNFQENAPHTNDTLAIHTPADNGPCCIKNDFHDSAVLTRGLSGAQELFLKSAGYHLCPNFSLA